MACVPITAREGAVYIREEARPPSPKRRPSSRNSWRPDGSAKKKEKKKKNLLRKQAAITIIPGDDTQKVLSQSSLFHFDFFCCFEVELMMMIR